MEEGPCHRKARGLQDFRRCHLETDGVPRDRALWRSDSEKNPFFDGSVSPYVEPQETNLFTRSCVLKKYFVPP